MEALFNYLPIVLIFVIFYMLVIRPQGQAAKAHAALLAALKKGDVVVTDGGLVGEIVAVKSDKMVWLDLGNGVRVTLSRAAVQKVLSDADAKGWQADPKPAKK